MRFLPFLTFQALVNIAVAHFILNYPPSLGFIDDTEGTAPCGGVPIVFGPSDANVTVEGYSP